MIKNYKCGTKVVHSTAMYASGGRLRKVVNISTKRMARATTYNMIHNTQIGMSTASVVSRLERSCTAKKASQGVQVIATALMRHSTCSWYVGKAKNQAIQWMPPNTVAISNPESTRKFLSGPSRLILPSNVGTWSFRDVGLKPVPVSSSIGRRAVPKIPSLASSSLSSILRQT
jgi:hypothetical protein